MKIYCKQCRKDISKEVDKQFEKIYIGKIRCPKCGSTQSRFIDQTDLYLYNGITGIIYLVLTVLAIKSLELAKDRWWLYLIFGIILILTVLFVKQVSRIIYKKKFKKVDYVMQKNDEANQSLRKEINTSFLIFVLFAILAIMNNDYSIEFLFGQFVIVVICFLKFYLSIKKGD